MTPLARKILDILPCLRRYACALTGDRRTGDNYVRVTLETLLEEPWRIAPASDVRLQLYRLFHDVLSIFTSDSAGDVAVDGPEARLERQLRDLPLATRKLVLLATLEGFSIRAAAELLGLSERAAARQLNRAQLQLKPIAGKPRKPPSMGVSKEHRAA